MAFASFFGSLHPILVHFPIALWTLAFLVDLLANLRSDERLSRFSLAMLLIGTLISGFTGVSGILAQVNEVRRGIPEDPTEYHERWALVTMGWFIALSLVRMFHGVEARPAVRWGLMLAFALGIAMLTYTGYKGGEIVQQYGATVEGASPKYGPSDESLQLIAARQTIEGRQYSSFMHHMAGIMSMLLAIFLAVAQARPALQAKVISATPWLLILGGIGLFIFSDTDSFPLDSQRPLFKDPEVIFHKVVAFLMIGSGWAGTRRRQDPAEKTRIVGRSIGLLALAGGGLLFTHIHSASPYSDVAVGVYLYHMVMASVAIAIGCVKLFEERLAGPERLKAFLFPGLIAIEAVLLLTYTEGLPWFLGYTPMLRDGPHSDGLTSQVGDHRAELVFEPDTAALNVYLFELEEDRPWNAPLKPMPAVVRLGTEATALELLPQSPSHFRAVAPFLRGARFFNLEIAIPDRYARVQFEPWTSWREGSPRVARRPASVCLYNQSVDLGASKFCPTCGRETSKDFGACFAQWACPTHASVGAGERVTCSLCGRWLQLNPRRPGAAKLTVEGKIEIAAGVIRVKLDAPLGTLRGERGHLDIFGPGSYAHAHLDAAGECPFAFPAAGRYVIFASVLPEGGALRVLREEWIAGGPASEPAPPRFEASAVEVEGYRVSVTAQPWPVGPGDESHLFFEVTRGGKPVVDLEPVEGMPALCVAASDDGETFECAHPLGGPESFGGPVFRYHWLPPKLGAYRLYLTFRHGGRSITAALGVRAQQRALPGAIDPGER